MMQRNCCKCMAVFTPVMGGNNTFCPQCVVKLREGAAEAEKYQQQIAAGDVNVTPNNDADRQRLKSAIRKRLSNSIRDCEYKHST